jgi:DNA topoisomerase-1|tara:strand:+ start:5042 stop:7354 length:2313 start_codon:yes stop_codon:yes gene_type:complete
MKIDNLVIVESPAKAKIITKYLNSIPELKKYGNFNVIASYGHIRDLSKKDGIDIKNNFKPNYVLLGTPPKLKGTSSKSKVSVNSHTSNRSNTSSSYKDIVAKTLQNLKDNIKKSKTIWLAADFDREGESIAWHIKDHFKLKNYKRITFNEITKESLKNAVLNPRNIDMNLVDAQQARRFLDRIVGFEITPLLWNRFNTNLTLSTGRVQSATLNIIINKENEIKKHKSESYYTAIGSFKMDDFDINEAKYEVKDTIYKFKNNKEATSFLKSLKSKYFLEDIKTSNRSQKPPLPFITSTLQQTASGELKMSIKQVMGVAQGLYEAGLITYMRTDSYNLSTEILQNIEKYVKQNYGDKYYLGENRKKKSKNSQEAHEAIRPSNINKLSKDIKLTGKIKEEHKKLYDLIWKRTIASQMQSAKYYDIRICIKNEVFSQKECFVGKFKIFSFDGYLAIYGQKIDNNFNLEKYIKKISNLKKNLKMLSINAKNTWTIPPQRFSEATIVKILENVGIGRPSTYSSILGKLYEKNYIEKKDILGEQKEYINYTLLPNKKIKDFKVKKNLTDEKSKLISTDIGFQINDYMITNFENIIDPNFTSIIEEDFDKIATGEKKLINVMKPFYKDFSKTVISAKNKNKNINSKKEPKIKLNTFSNEITVQKIQYTIRIAKYGPVIQFKDSDSEKNKYVSLVPYLKASGKDIQDINKKDIKLLTSLPSTIGKYNNSDVKLLYARYGFYLQNGNKTASIFRQYNDLIINNKFEDIIELVKNKKIQFK